MLLSPSEAWKVVETAFSLSCSLDTSLLFCSSCFLHSSSLDWPRARDKRTTHITHTLLSAYIYTVHTNTNHNSMHTHRYIQ